MDSKAFSALVAEIQKQGYDEATAAHYASLIGDRRCVDKDGNLLVLDPQTGKVLARLKPWPE